MYKASKHQEKSRDTQKKAECNQTKEMKQKIKKNENKMKITEVHKATIHSFSN